jgi:chemotaxis protein histidine kinase CheA
VAAAGSQPSLAEVDRSSTQSFKQRAAAQAAELARQAAAAAAQAAKEARERAQAMAAAAQEARQKAAQEAEEQRQRDAAAVAEQDQRRKEQEEARATAAAAAAQEEFVKQRRSSAAVTIQKYWRRHAAQAAAAHLRAVRQLCRRVAAHTIQRAWRGWRVNRGWVLGPLRVPAARPLSSSTTTTGTSSCSQQRPCSASSSSGTGTTPPPSGGCTPSPRRSLQHQPGSMKSPGASPQQQPAGKPPTGAASGDHSKVLSKPLRVRSTADARLAPEAAGGEGPPSSAKSGSPDQRGSPGGGETSGASKNRVVASTKARVADVVADEGVRRGELERRAIMAASEHRDAAQVMALIRSSSART